MNAHTATRRFAYSALAFSALFFATVFGSMPSFVHSDRYIPKWLFVLGSGALLLLAIAGCAISVTGLVVSFVVGSIQRRCQKAGAPRAVPPEQSGA